MSDSNRTYTEQQVDAILRRAIAMQEREPGSQPAPGEPVRAAGGVSLQTIQEIAQEIGVEPHYVAEAATALSPRDTSTLGRLAGAPTSVHLEDTYPGPLTANQRLELVDTIRRTLRQHGTVGEVLGSMEWKSPADQPDQVAIAIGDRDDRIRVQILSDRSILAWLTWATPSFVTFLIGVIAVKKLEVGVGVGAAILGTALATGLAVGRTIWVTMSRRAQRRLQQLRQGIGRVLAAPDDSSPER